MPKTYETKLSGVGAFQPCVVVKVTPKSSLSQAYEDFTISAKDFPLAVTTHPAEHTAHILSSGLVFTIW